MTFDHIGMYKKGWFIGNFEPSLCKQKDFEVALQTHPKGYVGDKHFHNHSTEYNLIVNGKMIINGNKLGPGDIFIFHPREVSDSEFLEDTTLVVVRTPSDPTDKHLV